MVRIARRPPALPVLLSLGLSPLPALGVDLPAERRCAASLDRAVTLAADGDTVRAERTLRALGARCPELLPAIAHNLGVLAARDGRPREAMTQLERALLAEPGTAGTLAALRALHRREAAIAYARALGDGATDGAGGAPALPPLRLRGSGTGAVDRADDRGVAAAAATSTAAAPPRDIATLEYELYAWWQSAADPASRLEHYVAGYPRGLALADRGAGDGGDGGATPWSAVRREIAFTARDAVAVLEHPGADGATARRLLLLRLEGSRWKIYAERPL